MSTKDLEKAKNMPSAFEDFFKPLNDWFFDGIGWNRLLTVPPVNITGTEHEYVINLAIPGMSKDDFRIDVDGNVLSISSEKKERKEENEKNYTRQEYSYSSFRRSFTLPDKVDMEKIDAGYKDGVLSVSLPVKAAAKASPARKIKVN